MPAVAAGAASFSLFFVPLPYLPPSFRGPPPSSSARRCAAPGAAARSAEPPQPSFSPMRRAALPRDLSAHPGAAAVSWYHRPGAAPGTEERRTGRAGAQSRRRAAGGASPPGAGLPSWSPARADPGPPPSCPERQVLAGHWWVGIRGGLLPPLLGCPWKASATDTEAARLPGGLQLPTWGPGRSGASLGGREAGQGMSSLLPELAAALLSSLRPFRNFRTWLLLHKGNQMHFSFSYWFLYQSGKKLCKFSSRGRSYLGILMGRTEGNLELHFFVCVW